MLQPFLLFVTNLIFFEQRMSRVRPISHTHGFSRGRAEDDHSTSNGLPKTSRAISGDTSRTRSLMPRPRRPLHTKTMADLEDNLAAHESLIKALQSQLVTLKSELEDARSSNALLLSNNRKLSQDLASAEAKISALSSPHHHKPTDDNPRFKDIQRLIATKLEDSVLHSNPIRAASPSPPPFPKFLAARTRNSDEKDETSSHPTPPPPPPPPPPPRPPSKAPRAQKSPPVAQLFHMLKKRDACRDPSPSMLVSSVHSSIVGEIQNRSAHLLAIKSDIETKGDFVNHLIQKVLAATFSDMEDVLTFVDWLDEQLSSLADERAVLKHFKWPEKKADTLREAAIEYRDLRKLENELSSYSDDLSIQLGTALKKMTSLLDKSEQSTQRLVRLRSAAMLSYEEFRIPAEWMLDSGMISKIKRASIKLARTYMRRVAAEVESGRHAEREEALVLQGVRFAHRTYQFAGGLDSETLCALEEIKERVPSHHLRPELCRPKRTDAC